ncbi:COP9 signalosome complex subunit 2 [Gossypium australe]|uniref:COP9 signalosome complex subunit 2 n=1 Tax=Gossypium australe TaxID=47621 RepID=A0A5B6UIV3_9ROSI|nr:COP9 signalosome complex subunit 2 [Gossypium australe]
MSQKKKTDLPGCKNFDYEIDSRNVNYRIWILCIKTVFSLSQPKLTPIGSNRRCQQCLVLKVWSAPNSEVFIKSPDFK